MEGRSGCDGNPPMALCILKPALPHRPALAAAASRALGTIRQAQLCQILTLHENSARCDLGMSRSVDRTRQARADLKKLSKRNNVRVRQAVRRFVDTGQGDTKRLRGVDPPTHRLRVGSWRVMAQLERTVIRIMRVLHRREAYKRSCWARQELPQQRDVGDRERMKASGDHGE